MFFVKVGACIVNEDKKIVGIGYNGMPEIISDEEAPWDREEKRPYGKNHLKL